MSVKTLLTKSDYLNYLQCSSHFWFTKHQPERLPEESTNSYVKQLADQGNEVELCARQLFPNGVLVKSYGEQSVNTTNQLIEEGKEVIFQASFQFHNLYVKMDVLERSPFACTLFVHFLQSLSEETGCTYESIRVVVNSFCSDYKQPTAFFHNFLHAQERNEYLENLLRAAFGDECDVVDRDQMPHYREMVLKANNETISIRPDGGIAYGWDLRDYVTFDEDRLNRPFKIEKKPGEDILYYLKTK